MFLISHGALDRRVHSPFEGRDQNRIRGPMYFIMHSNEKHVALRLLTPTSHKLA